MNTVVSCYIYVFELDGLTGIHLYVYKKVAKWMNMAVFYSSNVESTIIILVVLDILIYIGYVP